MNLAKDKPRLAGPTIDPAAAFAADPQLRAETSDARPERHRAGRCGLDEAPVPLADALEGGWLSWSWIASEAGDVACLDSRNGAEVVGFGSRGRADRARATLSHRPKTRTTRGGSRAAPCRSVALEHRYGAVTVYSPLTKLLAPLTTQ
jgi:hypothetical protein